MILATDSAGKSGGETTVSLPCGAPAVTVGLKVRASGALRPKYTVFDTSDLDAEKTALEQEMVVVSEMMQQSIYENARVALDQTEYQKRYDGLTERFGKAKARLEKVTEVISDKQTRQATIEDFLKELQTLDGMVTNFDPMLWVSLVDFITVHSKDDVRVTFKDGTEIRA